MKKTKASLVPLIITANIVIFFIIMFFNNCPKNDVAFTLTFGDCIPKKHFGRFSFQPLADNPLLGPSKSTLVSGGGLTWDLAVNGTQPWRVFTSSWLHAGLIHLVSNMFGLILIGISLEQKFGPARIAVLYIVCSLGGTLLSLLFLRGTVAVGASGAVFGLRGAMLSEMLTNWRGWKNWTIWPNKAFALMILVTLICFNLAIGLLPHVDNFANVGSLVTGFMLGFVLLLRPQIGWRERHLPEHSHVKSKYLRYQLVLFTIALAMLIAWFTAVLIMVFNKLDANDYCSWCRYLSCIPTKHVFCVGGRMPVWV